MPPAPTPDVPAWTVTSQVPTTAADAQGTYVPGFRVQFRTAAGLTGSVFVPETDYAVETVRAAINARAALLSGVAALEG